MIPSQCSSSSPWPTFPLVLLVSTTPAGVEHPLGQLCPLPAPWSPPTCSLVGWGERLCVSTAQQQLKHPCIINTISSTNLKYSPILTAVKKITWIAAGSSAPAFCKVSTHTRMQKTLVYFFLKICRTPTQYTNTHIH